MSHQNAKHKNFQNNFFLKTAKPNLQNIKLKQTAALS